MKDPKHCPWAIHIVGRKHSEAVKFRLTKHRPTAHELDTESHSIIMVVVVIIVVIIIVIIIIIIIIIIGFITRRGVTWRGVTVDDWKYIAIDGNRLSHDLKSIYIRDGDHRDNDFAYQRCSWTNLCTSWDGQRAFLWWHELVTSSWKGTYLEDHPSW